jgi:hypothetical protein
MAERVQLTEWEKALAGRIRALQGGLVVNTLEEGRAIRSILTCAIYLSPDKLGKRHITRWSEVSTMKIDICKPNAAPKFLEQIGLFKMITTFLEEMRKDDHGKDVPQEGILILSDIQKIISRDTNIVRLLRESATRIREHGLYKTIIIMGDAFTLPPELRTEFVTIEFDIPTTDHLFQMLSKLIDSIREKGSEAYAHIQPSEEVLRAFASACTGLTENEMRSLMSSSIAKFRTLDEQGVQFAQQEKARILLQGGALSIRKPRGGLEIVGGMEGVKGWVNSINNLIKHPAEASAYGLRIPSGLLMVGVSGAGKSLMAEALGGHWQLPVLLFDVGAAYGSLVGESEANIRRMQKMANAMKPCIVYIDEIEKGLGGDGMDGGTSNRCKQSLLTWLNDKDPQIFVVATANDLSKLNQIPELTRAGRFDAQFFVDLPSATARLEIFKIHLRATGHDMPENALTDVVEATHGYSGAEIEAIVQDALREAFNAEPQLDHPTGEMLCECACQRKPLSLVMQETISQLRELVKSGRILPAGSSVEDDLRGRHRKKEEQVLADSQEALPGLLNSLGFETTEEE